ncbi:MAG: hypothetical protein AAF502_00150 [Bacteroidota bacterium]
MRDPITEWLYKTLQLDLPHLESLDEYVDFILPRVAGFSEDLYEQEFYTEKPWLEVRDDENFLDEILHIFKKPDKDFDIKTRNEDEGPDYLVSTDGNVRKGVWTYLQGQSSNIILIKTDAKFELYKKVFINADFFILKKHGNKHLSGKQRKYFFMARENRVKGMEWREIMEVLFNIYRNRLSYIGFIAAMGVIIAIILFFSLR